MNNDEDMIPESNNPRDWVIAFFNQVTKSSSRGDAYLSAFDQEILRRFFKAALERGMKIDHE